jgi:hypothetical protein
VAQVLRQQRQGHFSTHSHDMLQLSFHSIVFQAAANVDGNDELSLYRTRSNFRRLTHICDISASDHLEYVLRMEMQQE